MNKLFLDGVVIPDHEKSFNMIHRGFFLNKRYPAYETSF